MSLQHPLLQQDKPGGAEIQAGQESCVPLDSQLSPLPGLAQHTKIPEPGNQCQIQQQLRCGGTGTEM